MKRFIWILILLSLAGAPAVFFVWNDWSAMWTVVWMLCIIAFLLVTFLVLTSLWLADRLQDGVGKPDSDEHKRFPKDWGKDYTP